MELHVDDPGKAVLAVETIFGEDIAAGPLREVPEALRHALDLPAFDTLAQVELRPPVFLVQDAPPLMPGYILTLHRMPVICHGRLLGYALRMAAKDLALLAHWERKSGLTQRPS